MKHFNEYPEPLDAVLVIDFDFDFVYSLGAGEPLFSTSLGDSAIGSIETIMDEAGLAKD